MTSPDSDEYLALFGGRHLNKGAGFHSTAAGAYTYFNELWLYSFKTNTWSKPEIAGPLPPARDHHGTTALNGKLYVFGGRCSEERAATSVFNDLWSFSMATMTWTLHNADGAAPTARFMPGMAGTKVNEKDVIAVFAGESFPGHTSKTTQNDVWFYEATGPDTGAWTQSSSTDCSAKAVAPELFHKGEEEELAEEGSNIGTTQVAGIAGLLTLFVAGIFGPRRRSTRDAALLDNADIEHPYIAVQ